MVIRFGCCRAGIVALGLVLAGPAAAADAISEQSGPETVQHMFDVAFGVALTSDYVSRGITQTDHGAAIQGYIEPSLGIVYGSLWASNVAFGGESDVEVDLTVGVRPEFDVLSFDVGYYHFFYLNDPGSDGGEFFAKAYATVAEPVVVGGEVYFNPDDSATYIEANADLTLPHNFGLSGAIGAVGGDAAYTTWNAGIYYLIGEWGTLDVRYSDTSLSTDGCVAITELTGNECDARLVLSLSVDTSLSALSGGE